jgi:outer membrane protein
MNKSFFAGLVLVLVLSVGGALAADGVKLGYVDLQKALNLSDAGKAAKEQLAIKQKKYQEELNSRQEELKKLRDELEKQGKLISDSARASKERDYQQKAKEYERFVKDANDDLGAKDNELTKQIVEDLEKVIQEYGQKNGYTFIFVRNESMIFADDKADVTADVLKIFNSSRKK